MQSSSLFKLNAQDFLKGATTAVLAGIIFAIYGITSQNGFDLFSVDWKSILTLSVNAGFASFIGYITKNFLSDQNGAVLGAYGGSK